MGKLITFEGIEGCGKTTQIKLLGDYLRKKGYTIYETREPGGTLIGDQIRRILLNPENKGINYITELLLYEACRAQLVKELSVRSEELGVKDKEIILCDRFTDSTLAYQGYGRGIDKGVIKELNKIASGGAKPVLTILLDLDVKTGLGRAIGRNINSQKSEVRSQESAESRFEEEALEFHLKVREGFLKIASEEPERIKIVDANKGIEDIHKEIVKIVENYVI
ncbi:MAG: dTMP kinase [Nitrospinae bacterium]|nr:dTMP kinase [Nitrospinota bacterium]